MLVRALIASGSGIHPPTTGTWWIDTLIVVTIIGGAAAVLRKPITAVRRVFRFLDNFRDDWDGVPDRPGVPGRSGVMVRLKAIEAEVRPNGGGSIKDAVNAIRADVGAARTEAQAAHQEAQAAHAKAEETRKIALRTDKALTEHLKSISAGGGT